MTTRARIRSGYEPRNLFATIKMVMLAMVGVASQTRRVTMPKVNEKKFKELVLYVSQKSDGDIKFGSTKLNKIVAFADMIHFMKTGKSITNASYMKQPQGVVARCMKPTLDKLQESQELAIVPKEQWGFTYKVPTALRSPKLDVFEPAEIETVEEVLKGLKDHNNSDVSYVSHRNTPNWEFLPVSVEIPISALLYPSEYKLTPEVTSRFKQLLRETDWGKEVLSARATP